MKPVSLLVLVSMLAGALAFPGLVSAAGLAQDPQPQAATQPPDPAQLEQRYERMQNVLERQGNRLDRTDEVVARAEERIAELKTDGKDTRALETALADFQDQVALARQAYQAAAATLEAHDGFDASGAVTDAGAAQKTLQDAASSMRAASQDLRPAVFKLMRAIRQYMRANH